VAQPELNSDFNLRKLHNPKTIYVALKKVEKKLKMSEEDPCALVVEDDYEMGLHVGTLFIIMGCSLFGTLLPVAAKRFPFLAVSEIFTILFKNDFRSDSFRSTVRKCLEVELSWQLLWFTC
jgi:hypothetical protein